VAGSEKTDTIPVKTKEMDFDEWGRQFKQWVDNVRKLNAQLRYYYGVEPGNLSITEWAFRVNEMKWIRQEEAKQNGN